jgi:hypothetical protein
MNKSITPMKNQSEKHLTSSFDNIKAIFGEQDFCSFLTLPAKMDRYVDSSLTYILKILALFDAVPLRYWTDEVKKRGSVTHGQVAL